MSRSRPGRLQRLDAVMVPRIAAMFRVTGAGLAELGRATGSPGRLVSRLARRNAVIAVVVLAAVVAVVLVVVRGHGDHHDAAAPPPAAKPPPTALSGNQLGPTTGQTVDSYSAEAAARRSALKTSQAAQATAVVDLNSYLTAAATRSLLNGLHGVTITLAYAKVADSKSAGVHAIDLTSGAPLASQLKTISTAQQQFVTRFQRESTKARQHPTANNLRVVATDKQLAHEAQIETTSIGPDIGCVYALTVTGPPAQLTTLAAKRDVRILDPAPAGTPTANLAVIPLAPEITGKVPVVVFDRLAAGTS